MGIFATGGRRGDPGPLTPASATTSRESMGLPVGFEAVGEALTAEECPLAACDAVGREMALDGASAQEALSGLRTTWQVLVGQDPGFEPVQALMVGWSEAALASVNQIGCEDPLTGLASAAHLRSAFSGLFRDHHNGAGHPRETHALVVVDLPGDATTVRTSGDPLGRALRLARLGDAARTVFPGGDVIARVSPHRISVLTARDPRLGVRVRLLRRLVEGMDLSGRQPRVWIEGLAASDLACGFLIEELARP